MIGHVEQQMPYFLRKGHFVMISQPLIFNISAVYRHLLIHVPSDLMHHMVLYALKGSFTLKPISPLQQRFSNCGPRTTSGPRVLPL
jgi:hypothetical protein